MARFSRGDVLAMAKIYSEIGSLKNVGKLFGVTDSCVQEYISRYSDSDSEIAHFRKIGFKKGLQNRRNARGKPFHIRNDIALARDREIYERRASVPDPITIGQQLMGEPLPGRSALDKIKAETGSDSTERNPAFTVKVVADYGSKGGNRYNRITLPNIRIGHSSTSSAPE